MLLMLLPMLLILLLLRLLLMLLLMMPLILLCPVHYMADTMQSRSHFDSSPFCASASQFERYAWGICVY